jgi:hypothetical protein
MFFSLDQRWSSPSIMFDKLKVVVVLNQMTTITTENVHRREFVPNENAASMPYPQNIVTSSIGL